MSGAVSQTERDSRKNTKITVDGDTEPLATVTLSLIGRSTFLFSRLDDELAVTALSELEKKKGALSRDVCVFP